MRIGLLGGTFDPVHKGHIALARSALKELKLDRLYFVLSPRSPFKLRKKQTTARDRLAMLRFAVSTHPKFKLGLWEYRRRGVSYTVSTLKQVRRQFSSSNLFLVMGSDVYASFNRWKNPAKIINLSMLVVGRRPQSKPLRIPKSHKNGVHVLRGRFPIYSSSKIRKQVKKNTKSSSMLLSKVAGYIHKKGLYQ